MDSLGFELHNSDETLQLNQSNIRRVNKFCTPTKYTLHGHSTTTPKQIELYREKITELTEKVQMEELLKVKYQNALKEFRSRLSEIEHRDCEQINEYPRPREDSKQLKELELNKRIEQLSLENAQLHCRYTSNHEHGEERLKRVYSHLKDENSIEISRLSQRVYELERENDSVRNKCKNLVSVPSPSEYSAIIESLLQERLYLKERADFTRKLEEELSSIKQLYEHQLFLNRNTQNELKTLYETQISHTEHTPLRLRLNQNTNKITELESRLRRTTKKYTKLETSIRKQKHKSISKKRTSSRNPPKTPTSRSSTAKRRTPSTLKYKKRKSNL